MASALDLRLQASTPSDHLCLAFLLPTLPQLLYQAPPGAQQLTLPDFLNVPHFGHVILYLTEVMDVVLMLIGVAIDARTISSRSGSGRRDTYWSVVAKVHTSDDIDPHVPANMSFWVAFELTQAGPHSLCLNDVVGFECQNM